MRLGEMQYLHFSILCKNKEKPALKFGLENVTETQVQA